MTRVGFYIQKVRLFPTFDYLGAYEVITPFTLWFKAGLFLRGTKHLPFIKDKLDPG